MQYWLVKSVRYIVVEAVSEEKAIECYRCPLHGQNITESAMVVNGPIEAQTTWEAQEKLRLK